ncbi:MAG: flagellar protein FlgN [Firmicutes bacterium]|nr:flagellar protein FlgN [Bacillota bacterium]
MRAGIDGLIGILEEQAACCAGLLELSREKRGRIIENDIDALRRITRLENGLVGGSAAAGRAAAAALRDLAADFSKEPENFTAGELAGLLGGRPEKTPLTAAINAIRETAGELNALNAQNRLLIESSLEYIDFSMNLLREALCGEPFYTAAGEELPATGGFLDAKS